MVLRASRRLGFSRICNAAAACKTLPARMFFMLTSNFYYAIMNERQSSIGRFTAQMLCALALRCGRFPEWPKGADCKSVGSAFGGSNPPSPTTALCGYRRGFYLAVTFFTFMKRRGVPDVPVLFKIPLNGVLPLRGIFYSFFRTGNCVVSTAIWKRLISYLRYQRCRISEWWRCLG